MVITLKVNGKDISSDLKKYFTSIEIIDKDGVESDELNITVSDAIKRPKYEDELKIWIDGVFYGTYLVQSTSTNHLKELEIRATGINFSSTIKSKKNRSFHDTTLYKIIETIATDHNINSKIDFKDTEISTLIQEKESDLHFLTRLAREYDAIFSVKNNTLLFLNRESISPEFSMDLRKVSSYTIEHSNKKIYGSCIASFRDTKENRIKSVQVGVGEPVLRFQDVFNNEEEAKQKANAKLQRANRGIKAGNLIKEGEYLSAGSTLVLSGSTQDDGEYTIERVTTTINQNGWVIDVDFQS